MSATQQKKFYKIIGERIHNARLKISYNQEGLAKSVNLTRVSIVNIEKGRQHPSTYLLWRIAKVLKVDIIDLLPPDGIGDKVSVDLKKLVDKKTGKSNGNTKLIEFITEVSSSNPNSHD